MPSPVKPTTDRQNPPVTPTSGNTAISPRKPKTIGRRPPVGQNSGISAKLAQHKAQRGTADPLPPHLIIIARAGTGKTTTGVGGMHYLRGTTPSIVPSPQQQAIWDVMAMSKDAKHIAMVAFNKTIAEELGRRVPQGIDTMTLHSMGLKAIRRSGIRLYPGKDQISGYKVSNILEAVTGKRRSLSDPTLWSAVEKLVGLCKVNLIGTLVRVDGVLTYEADQDSIERLAQRYDIVMPSCGIGKVAELVTKCMTLSVDSSKFPCIDFNDMIWWPVILDLPMFRYDLMYVDEAQDLNTCQQHLSLKSSKRLVFCGDDRQAIYGFAGSDTESIKYLHRTLMSTKAGCVTLPLTTTRRCAKAIVREAQKDVPDFEAHETNPEGRVVTMYSEKNAVHVPCKDGELPSDKVLSDNQVGYRSFVRPGDMVVSRVNAPLVSEAMWFLTNRRKANIAGRNIGDHLAKLVKKLGTNKTLPEFIKLVYGWRHSETAKEMCKPNPSDNVIIAIEDKAACLLAFAENAKSVKEMIKMITELFSDKSEGVLLSSIHKAKGLEADRVFFLCGKNSPCPHPMAKQPWAYEQEINCRYIARTRAISELVYVL